MLNTQDLCNHIRIYSDASFLHTAYALILQLVYPETQQYTRDGRDATVRSLPPTRSVYPN